MHNSRKESPMNKKERNTERMQANVKEYECERSRFKASRGRWVVVDELSMMPSYKATRRINLGYIEVNGHGNNVPSVLGLKT